MISNTFDLAAAQKELLVVMGESKNDVVKRQRCAFDELAAPFERSLVLFGAGNLGRKVASGLRKVGIEPLAFVDNAEAMWGQRVLDIPVMSLRDAAAKYGASATFVICVWGAEGSDRMVHRQAQLREQGLTHVATFAHLFWKFPEVFCPHFSVDLPSKVFDEAADVAHALTLMSDDASRRQFISQLRFRVFGDFAALPLPDQQQLYVPSDVATEIPDEVFVDCGAFDGDSIRWFLKQRAGVFGSIVAFEADPRTFQKLSAFVAQLPAAQRERVTLHEKAVGAKHERVIFTADGTVSAAVGSGSLEVESVPLDAALGASGMSFLKMDIEGSEVAALIGARETISKNPPVVAACVYHLQDHMWRVPLLLSSYSNSYSFFLRQHLLDAWDLVCYAVPRERLCKK